MKLTNQHLINKLEEVKEIDFIDLVQDKRLLTEGIESNIEAPQEELPKIETLIETFLEWFAYSREIKRRANEAARKRGE